MPGEANNNVSVEAMATFSRTASDLDDMTKEIHKCRSHGEHADLLIQCDDKRIKCHRLVLGAHSRFLLGIMASLPEECPSCSGDGMALLVLPGVEYEVLKIVIKFLYTGSTRVTQKQVPQVRKLLQGILRVDAKIDMPRSPGEEEEEAEMAAAAAAALNIKSEPRDFDDDHDGAGTSGTGGASSPPSGSATGGSSSSSANGTSNGGAAMDMSKPGPSNHHSSSDHGCSAEIKADFIPPSPPDSNQGDDGNISENEEASTHTTDLNENSCDVSQDTKEADCDKVEEVPIRFQISDIRGTTESPEANTNAHVLNVEDDEDGNLAERCPDPESPEANTNEEIINVEDDDEDGNSAERGSDTDNGGIGDSERAVPEFVPAPSVISKKTSRSNNAFFATKSTSSAGSGGSPKKVIAKRPGGHLRDGGGRAKKTKVAREIDDDYVGDDSDASASSSDSDSGPAPSPDIAAEEDPDFSLGQDISFDHDGQILLDLPNPIPEPPEEGLVIHRGEWVTPAKRNRLLSKRDRPRTDVRKYNYKPFESTITGYSKLSTVAAAEEEVDGVFTCPECDAKFARERSLNSHISRAHNANAKWPCPENCGKMLSSQTAIKKHLLSHRPESEWPYQCR